MRIYFAKPGDTLGTIAERYALDLETLQMANPQINNPDTLQAGTKIKLPSSQEFVSARAEQKPEHKPVEKVEKKAEVKPNVVVKPSSAIQPLPKPLEPLHPMKPENQEHPDLFQPIQAPSIEAGSFYDWPNPPKQDMGHADGPWGMPYPAMEEPNVANLPAASSPTYGNEPVHSMAMPFSMMPSMPPNMPPNMPSNLPPNMPFHAANHPPMATLPAYGNAPVYSMAMPVYMMPNMLPNMPPNMPPNLPPVASLPAYDQINQPFGAPYLAANMPAYPYYGTSNMPMTNLHQPAGGCGCQTAKKVRLNANSSPNIATTSQKTTDQGNVKLHSEPTSSASKRKAKSKMKSSLQKQSIKQNRNRI